jgi:cysteine protease ATG4
VGFVGGDDIALVDLTSQYIMAVSQAPSAPLGSDNSFTSSSPPISSSSQPSTSSHPSSSSTHSNLPKPPPPGRQPSSKGRSLHNTKLRLPRRKRRDDDGEHEEWTLEDGSRASIDGGREEFLASTEDLEGTDKGKKEEKESKGRRLAHKTSQLFSRKEKEKPNDDGQSNLSIPSTSRQTSFSSTASGESTRTTSSASARPVSHHSAATAIPFPKKQHSRRISQDSQTSWHGIPRTGRAGSSSTESPVESNLPIPRRQSSNLSASVPSLSRNALPQPSLAPSSMSTLALHPLKQSLLPNPPPQRANLPQLPLISSMPLASVR